MKLGMLLGISLIIVCIILFEWPKLANNQKKEKVALVVISLLGWFLAFVLVLFPDILGPTQFIHALFKPLESLFE